MTLDTPSNFLQRLLSTIFPSPPISSVQTPLSEACLSLSPSLVSHYLQTIPPRSSPPESDPLILVLRSYHKQPSSALDIIRLLVNSGALLSGPEPFTRSSFPPIVAVRLDLPEALSAMLSSSPHILPLLLSFGVPKLACSLARSECLNVLLEYGINPNLTDCHKTPLLHDAINAPHAPEYSIIATAGILLDRGADVHYRDCFGRTAVRIAHKRNLTQTVKLLRRHDAEEEGYLSVLLRGGEEGARRIEVCKSDMLKCARCGQEVEWDVATQAECGSIFHEQCMH